MSLGYGPRTVTDGLVLYLDAANAKSYPGSGTTWFDLSGNKNNGILLNGVGYNNLFNGRLTFDGVDDYVSIPYDSSFDFDYITLEYIVKPEIQVHVRPFVNRSDNSKHFWRLLMSNPLGSTFNFQASINGATQIVVSTTLFETDKFYHVAVTYNGATLIMYINGIIEDSISVSGVIDKTNANIEIARNAYYSPDRYAKQDSGSLKIYNRALTESEIQQNFRAVRGRYGI